MRARAARSLLLGLLLLALGSPPADAQPSAGAARAAEDEAVARVAEDEDEARVAEATRGLLAERFPALAARLVPRVRRVAGPLPPGPLRLALTEADAVPRGPVRADVLDAAGRPVTWALLDVAHFDSVRVALRDVPRGAPVAPAALGVAWLDVTRFTGEPLRATVALPAGATARRPLRAGGALRVGDLEAPPAVDTGDAVTVRYRRGAFDLRLPARARERGGVGETVRVFCADTGATYRVRLTAPGEADWLETL